MVTRWGLLRWCWWYCLSLNICLLILMSALSSLPLPHDYLSLSTFLKFAFKRIHYCVCWSNKSRVCVIKIKGKHTHTTFIYINGWMIKGRMNGWICMLDWWMAIETDKWMLMMFNKNPKKKVKKKKWRWQYLMYYYATIYIHWLLWFLGF